MADGTVNRRGFLSATAVAAASGLVPAAATAQGSEGPGGVAGDKHSVSLSVNGRPHELVIDPRRTLLDLLRDDLALTGAKKGCDHGQCGACTVLVGGKRVLACLTLAAAVRAEVSTIEGLASADGALHPMQEAFMQEDAFQCGYCTPGQILSAIACVREKHANSEDEIREFMSGNICRCAAYPNIVRAIARAKSRTEA
ncbi:MAG TPA: (2Fe-2S)-binding protein [Hyphomicrobiaceae bacterium]|jgi:xanthine dehydrogenase YagT iron-sulfur-binding subunit|nr:(2Fe-2S)-binding protein [Hyphomicrobiaceae bacterium]